MAEFTNVASEAGVLKLLGATRLLKAGVVSPKDIRTTLRKGLPFSTLEAFCKHADLSLGELASILGIPERTLARRKESKHLTPSESDRLYRVARSLALAQSVLGDVDKASVWIKRPNRALGDEIPLSLLDTEIGARQVEDALLRVAYGIFS
jgi:putative toxin-antitoxin system antitoxin component (TIGR02293 family)